MVSKSITGQDRPSTAPRVCNGIYRFSLSSVFLNLRGFLLAAVLRPTSGECPPQPQCLTLAQPGQHLHRGAIHGFCRTAPDPMRAPSVCSADEMRSGDSSSVTHCRGACFQKPKHSVFPLLSAPPSFRSPCGFLSFHSLLHMIWRKKSSKRNCFSCNSLMSRELPNGSPAH